MLLFSNCININSNSKIEEIQKNDTSKLFSFDKKKVKVNKTYTHKKVDFSIKDSCIKKYTEGVVIFNNNINETSKYFTVWNSNKTEYLFVSFPNSIIKFNGKDEYNLYEYESNSSFFLKKYQFNPLLFYPETGEIIIFECYNKFNDWYCLSITLNKETKYLKSNNEKFIFKNWNDFFKDIFVSPKNNIVYFKPNEKSQKLKLEKKIIFKVEKIVDEEWIKVSCNKNEEKNNCKNLLDNNIYLKWRDLNNIYIDFYYNYL